MKSLVLLLFALVFVFFLAAACEAAGFPVEYGDVKYDVFRVAPDDHSVRLFWKDADGRNYADFGRIKSVYENNHQTLEFATNGGIFSGDHAPLGLYIENRVELQPLNTDAGRGNFFLMPNGVFYVTNQQFGIVTSRKFSSAAGDILYATQSGPMLVINGRINSKFSKNSGSLYIRSGVGIDRAGQAVFAISNSPVNFYTFASLFKKRLHCANALYLDGAISKMYLPQTGRDELGGDFAVIIAVGR